MPSRLRSISCHRRYPLTAGWELCGVPPDTCVDPPALERASVTWTQAQAPGTAAACLRAANQWSLDSPARRFDAEDWWYRVRFSRPPTPGDDPLVMGFDGLATVADVWLNGEHLLSTDNMFVAYECAVEARLRDDNELLIRCRALDKLLGAKRPRPSWRAPMVEHQQLRWFRTTLLGRTPGWSAPAAPVGPWRPVWLESRGSLQLRDLSLHCGVTDNIGWVAVGCKVLAPDAGEIDAIDLVVSRGSESHRAPLQLDSSTGSCSTRIQIPNPALWWPHTHGEPALYRAELAFKLRNCGEPIVADLGPIGLRTLTLVTGEGNDFAFHINGVPVFCRGACWTPPDPVALGADGNELRRSLDLVRSAGMNMLRVGGTMVYESDEFLDLCDAGGILLWQDFMFANMNYPEEDPAFAATVALEARQQLARLAGHPCLVLLCGNSELEQQAAMWGAPRESWTPRLFHEVLPTLAREHCPEVPYWPSSAHGGAFPHQGNAGTTSYYGVGAYLRPLEDARRAEIRFASECLAFANIPEDATLAKLPGELAVRCHHPAWKARTPRDLGAGWDFDDVRDHYLARLFGVDPLELRYADHHRYLTLGRIVSGEVMAGVFAEWRRKRSTCRGGLIWFWRDLWCGAGWGVVDAPGRPKAAYYYLRRALQPVAVFISDEGGNGLYVHVINEHAAMLAGTLELALYRDGEIAVGSASQPISLGRETVEWPAAALFPGFLDLSYAYRFGPPAHDLVVATVRGMDGSILSQAFHFGLGPRAAARADIGLSARIISQSQASIELLVSARCFAQSVWIEAEGFVADDAYFHLAPGAQRQVSLQRAADQPGRVLRGRVHALNVRAPAKIEAAT